MPNNSNTSNQGKNQVKVVKSNQGDKNTKYAPLLKTSVQFSMCGSECYNTGNCLFMCDL